MSTFDNPIVSLEKKIDFKDPHPPVNLADAYKDGMAYLNKMLCCDELSPHLPRCEIGIDPANSPGQKLLQALEDRGFRLEFGKKGRPEEISELINQEGNRRAELIFELKKGVHAESREPVNHDHKLTLRERAALRAVRHADDA